MSIPAVLDWDTPCFSNKSHRLRRVAVNLDSNRWTPFPTQEPITHGVDWLAPSFAIEYTPLSYIPAPSRQTMIYKVCGQTRTLIWKRPMVKRAEEQQTQTKPVSRERRPWWGIDTQGKPFVPITTYSDYHQRAVAVAFTINIPDEANFIDRRNLFVSVLEREERSIEKEEFIELNKSDIVAEINYRKMHPVPEFGERKEATLGLQGQTIKKQIERFPKFEDVHMSHGITRTPTARRVGTFYDPEYFIPKVVGYRTVQAGRPLWKVLIWDAPHIDVLLYELLRVDPDTQRKLRLYKFFGPPSLFWKKLKGVKGRKINEFFTSSCILGQVEVRVPVMSAPKGVYRRVNHKHLVAYDTWSRKDVKPVGYIVYRKVATA